MTPIEDRLHELMDRLDHRENRIQPSDKNLVWEAIQRLRSAYKDVRELEDEIRLQKDSRGDCDSIFVERRSVARREAAL